MYLCIGKCHFTCEGFPGVRYLNWSIFSTHIGSDWKNYMTRSAKLHAKSLSVMDYERKLITVGLLDSPSSRDD